MRLDDFRLAGSRAATLAATALMLAVTLGLSACGGGPKGGPVTTDDMSMGKADAPVTMIEYASASCPHCAKFNNDVFPEFKKKYIDTGKVHYVFREFLTAPVPVAAAGFLLARCAGNDRYFSVLDAVFRAQPEMFADGTDAGATPVLKRIAKDQAGMSEAQFAACIGNEDNMAKLNDRVSKYAADNKIQYTPTFVVGDKRVEGEVTLQQLDELIASGSKK
ncbi:MAG: disulfide bond formation protein DsbA [Caulobacter sp.]|nr:disulfide bond formation protein DsbA [Caulobacter sp.]